MTVSFRRVAATITGAILFLLAIAVESGHAFGWVRPDVLATLGSGVPLDLPGRHSLATLALLLAGVWGADRALASRIGAVLYLVAGVLVAPCAPWPWMIQGPAIVGAVALIAFLLAGNGRPRWRLHALDACWRDAAPPGRVLAVLALVLAVAAVAGELAELRNVITRQSDFGTFYRAAQAVRLGGDPYRVANGEYFYPPTFAIAMIPLTWASIAHASVIWFVLKSAMVVAALRLVYTGLEGARLPAAMRGGFAIGVLLVACRFWMTDLRFGNTNIVILFLSLAALAAGEARRNGRAGAWLAVASTIKLVPAVLAGWFVARRKWRVLAWFAVWLLAINLAPLELRPEPIGRLWSSYRQHGVEERLGAQLAEPDNQSLRGFLARTLPDARAVATLWAVASLVVAAGTILILAPMALATRWARTAAASAFFLVGLLISPGSWVVHYTAALLPLAAALRLLLEPGRARPLLLAAFVFANLVYTGSTFARATVRLAADDSLFVFATLALLVALLWELRRTTAPSPAARAAHPVPPPPLPPGHR
jgi:alpha-1,2-mannosyltransferase